MPDSNCNNGLTAWIQMPGSGSNSFPLENLPATAVDYSPLIGSPLEGSTTSAAALDALGTLIRNIIQQIDALESSQVNITPAQIAASLTSAQLADALTPAKVQAALQQLNLNIPTAADLTPTVLVAVLQAINSALIGEKVTGGTGNVRKKADGTLESVAFPSLIDIPNVTPQNNWTIDHAKYAQVAPKIYDVYLLARKSRGITIRSLETIALLPFTSAVRTWGSMFDSAVAQVWDNRFLIQGADSKFFSSAGANATSPSAGLYADTSALYAAFNQRVYTV